MSKGQFWRGYRRPVLRDGVFWFAILAGIAGMAVQAPLADWKGETLDWVVLAAEVVLTFAASFIIIGVLAATIRGFGEGWRTADVARRREAEGRTTGQPAPESVVATPAPAPVAPKPTSTRDADRPAAAVSAEAG